MLVLILYHMVNGRNFFTVTGHWDIMRGKYIMLKKLTVSNFKNFNKEIVFDLSAGNYEFSSNIVENKILKNVMIYGENGTGKSNLSKAIMDITTHLTDHNVRERDYNNYVNLNSKDDCAHFKYEFQFGEHRVVYQYDKLSYRDVLNEILSINDEVVVEASNHVESRKVYLAGADSLNLDYDKANISFVKYVLRNTILDKKDEKVQTFKKFEKFINSMLSFRSLEGNFYQGFKAGKDSLSEAITESGTVEGFEEFLNRAGIKYNLKIKEIDEVKQIYVTFKNGKEVNIFSIASKGTKVLILFYFWLLKFSEISLVVMDEFDSYYHNKLTRFVIEEVMKTNVQSILTTHNTSAMNNEILRPDAYYIIENNRMKTASESTDKELRKAHNIEKMYRAGAFNEQK